MPDIVHHDPVPSLVELSRADAVAAIHETPPGRSGAAVAAKGPATPGAHRRGELMKACEICGQPSVIRVKGWTGSAKSEPVALLLAWIAQMRAPMHYGCTDHIQDVVNHAKGEVRGDGRPV